MTADSGRITVEYVVENAEDYADERSTSVEWVVENAEDVADEENARSAATLSASCHQLVRRYGDHPETIDLVANGDRRNHMEFTEPGTVEVMWLATEGLVRFAETLVAEGFRIIDLTMVFVDGDPVSPLVVAALVEALATRDRRTTDLILWGRDRPILMWVGILAPNGDVIQVWRNGSVDVTPGGLDTTESEDTVLEVVRRLFGGSAAIGRRGTPRFGHPRHLPTTREPR